MAAMTSSKSATRRPNFAGKDNNKQQEQQQRRARSSGHAKAGSRGSNATWMRVILTTLLLSLVALLAWKLGASQSPEDALIAWIRASGGKFHAAIRTPRGGERGVFAARDFKMNAVMASVPFRRALWIPMDEFAHEEEVALVMLNATSPAAFKPYVRALPMLHDDMHTVTYYNFPSEYLHLVGSKAWANHMRLTHSKSATFWAKNSATLKKAGLIREKLRAAVVTAFTRMLAFQFEGVVGAVMVPLIDFANHHKDCLNYLEWGPCDYFSRGLNRQGLRLHRMQAEDDGRFGRLVQDNTCFYWRAGRNIRKGEELCLAYHAGLTPDQAMYLYGFVPSDPDPPLSALDEPLDQDDVYLRVLGADREPKRADGPADVLRSEVRRLQERIAALEALEEEEAATRAAPGDKGGAVLRSLKLLRRQRVAAMLGEVRRLEALIAGAA